MNEEGKRDPCKLNKFQGIDAWCTKERCIYWRLLEPQDLDLDGEQVEASSEIGCGLQHYGIFNNLTPEMAKWLLEMKKRLENTSPEAARSRITFHRREK